MNSLTIRLSKVATILLSVFLLGSTWVQALEQPIDINKADLQLFKELPFIGNAKAKAIVACRDKIDGFTALKDLQRCPEVDSNTFKSIRPYIIIKRSAKPPTDQQPNNSRKSPSRPEASTPIRNINGIIVLPNKTYYKSLMDHIRFAEERIDLSIFLFKATKSPKNKPALLAKALIAAQKRGVKVSIIMENSGYDANLNEENRRVANLLRKKGISIKFDSSKTTTHTKIAIIDSRFCFVGSHNYTHSSLSYNNELSLLIDSKEMAKKLLSYSNGIIN